MVQVDSKKLEQLKNIQKYLYDIIAPQLFGTEYIAMISKELKESVPFFLINKVEINKDTVDNINVSTKFSPIFIVEYVSDTTELLQRSIYYRVNPVPEYWVFNVQAHALYIYVYDSRNKHYTRQYFTDISSTAYTSKTLPNLTLSQQQANVIRKIL